MNYEDLKKLNEKVCNAINTHLNQKWKFSDPPEPNHNIKFLIMGMNPSSANDKTGVDDRYLNIFPEEFNRASKYKNQIKALEYQTYFKPPYLLIKQIDQNAKIFWKFKIHFDQFVEEIKKQDLDKYKMCDEFLKTLDLDGNKNDSYILFNDLIYVRERIQKSLANIEKDDELKGLICDLFDKQIRYYNPQILIINNAKASDFIRKHICCENHTKTTLRYKNTQIFFSGMLSNGQTDKYAKERLKAEILNHLSQNS